LRRAAAEQPCFPVVFVYEAEQLSASCGAKAHKEIVKLSSKAFKVKSFLTSWENLLEYGTKFSSELSQKKAVGGEP